MITIQSVQRCFPESSLPFSQVWNCNLTHSQYKPFLILPFSLQHFCHTVQVISASTCLPLTLFLEVIFLCNDSWMMLGGHTVWHLMTLTPVFESLKWLPILHFNLDLQCWISCIPWFSRITMRAPERGPESVSPQHLQSCSGLPSETLNFYSWLWIFSLKIPFLGYY